MKVVFDLGTPKQVRFFLPLAGRLQAKGCTTSFVTRDYTEVNILVDALGIAALRLGRHGGPTLLGKLRSAAERIDLVAEYLNRAAPDVLVALGSPDSVRAAFGLDIPVVSFCDLPEATAVARLTLPLATRVCAPWLIPAETFEQFGVTADRLHQYRALDPLAWLERHRVDEAVLERLGLDPQRPLVVCRETEWESAYVRTDFAVAAAEEFVRHHPRWQLLCIPRYTAHPYYDIPSLLARADLLIGGGGTMCVEAGYYGTPVLSTRPLVCHYMNWLFEEGLAQPCRTVAETVAAAVAVAERVESKHIGQTRAARVFQGMSFPVDELADVILATAAASAST